MRDRPPWIAAVLVFLAAAVMFAWIFTRPHSGKIGEAAVAPAVVAPRNIARAANGETVVQISRGEQSRIGLVTSALKPVSLAVEFTAYGTVVDAAPLMALSSQLEAAQATLAASRSQFDRAKLLHTEGQNVSLKDVQTAEAKFRADAAQFELIRQQLADNWGESIAAMSPIARAALIDALVRRSEGIVRAALPAGESISGEPAAAQVLVLGYETRPLNTQWIAYDPTVDPHLERKQGGWFVTAGFATGDQVVVTGAQTLLSKEMQSQVQNQQPDED